MASVAETIRKHHAEILRLRAEEAQKFVSARGLTEPAFVNILPSYLSSLSEADDKLGRVGSERRAVLESHLGARLRQASTSQRLPRSLLCWDAAFPELKSALRRSRKAKSVT